LPLRGAGHGIWLLALITAFWAVANLTAIRMLGGPMTRSWISFADIANSDYVLTTLVSLFDLRRVLIGAAAAAIFVALCLAVAHVIPSPPRRSAILAASGALIALVIAALMPPATTARFGNPLYVFAASFAAPTDAPDDLLAGLDPADGQAGDTVVDPLPRATVPPRPALARGDIRNVVLFVMESTSARFINGYGGPYEVTPNLAKLSPISLRVTDAYAHVPASNYSLVSMLTGIVPEVSAYGMADNRPDLAYDRLPALLVDQGYRTGFFSSSDNSFQNMGGFAQITGFQDVFDSADWPCDSVESYEGGVAGGRQVIRSADDRCTIPPVTRWIDAAPDDPFLLMIWTAMQHYPYYPGDAPQDFTADPDLNRHLNAIHVGDQALGQLVDHLRRIGRLDDTLIIVVGDHGEAFGEHNQFGHATELYDENIRVPLVLINERAFGGQTTPQAAALTAGLSDIPPTITDLLGLPALPGWHGHSLFDPTRPDGLMLFTLWNGHQLGLRMGPHKLIYNATTGEEQLFNLAADPGEAANLAATEPDLLAKARATLGTLLRQHATRLDPLLNPATGTTADSALSPADPVPPGQITLRLSGTAFQDLPRALVAVDGTRIAEIVVTDPVWNVDRPVSTAEILAAETTVVLPASLPACPKQLQITFLNDGWAGEGQTGDTNLAIGQIMVGSRVYDTWQFKGGTANAAMADTGQFILWTAGNIILPLAQTAECVDQTLTAPAQSAPAAATTPAGAP
jgi:arylsulfatase A-like enzyme